MHKFFGSVKRFRFVYGLNVTSKLVESETGSWVRYIDCERLITAIQQVDRSFNYSLERYMPEVWFHISHDCDEMTSNPAGHWSRYDDFVYLFNHYVEVLNGDH